MHLASDYIHPTPRGGRCRVRIFLPEEEQDAPVVICSELPNNGDTSITYAAEQLAAEVIRSHRLPTPLVWIEHWPKETTEGKETFELVVFSRYEVVERAPYLRETRARIGDATWKPLDRTIGGFLEWDMWARIDRNRLARLHKYASIRPQIRLSRIAIGPPPRHQQATDKEKTQHKARSPLTAPN